MNNLQILKKQYNYYLNRYYNGCNYLLEHPEDFDKYIKNVMDLKSKIDELLDIIMKGQEVTEDEVLGGFALC